MKKLLFLLLIPCMMAAGSSAQTINQNKMIQQAGTDLPAWLKKIPGGNERLYGFENRDEFSTSTLGKPYQVFTLSGDFFREEVQSGKNYLEPTGEWRIPVMVKQENRAVVTVVKKKNKWKIVSMGAMGLARELQEFEKYPELSNNSYLKLLRVYQLNSDFLFSGDPTSSTVELTVYPMHSASINITKIKENPKIKLGIHELLTILKESIR
jgi:hypothetical protein